MVISITYIQMQKNMAHSDIQPDEAAEACVQASRTNPCTLQFPMRVLSSWEGQNTFDGMHSD